MTTPAATTALARCPEWCYVPKDHPHVHRPPNIYEVQEAFYEVEIKHPSRCSWRKDIYDGCDCGVTAAVTALEALMREEATA